MIRRRYARAFGAERKYSDEPRRSSSLMLLQVFTMWAEGITKWEETRHGPRPRGIRHDEVAQWVPAISDLRIFPTTEKEWCCLRQGVYINDDKDLAQPFADARNNMAAAAEDEESPESAAIEPHLPAADLDAESLARMKAARTQRLAEARREASDSERHSVHFLHVPPPSDSSRSDRQRGGHRQFCPDVSIMPFLEALGIQKLSASISVAILPQGLLNNRPTLPNIVAGLFPCVQRWLFAKRGRDDYLLLEEHLSQQNRPLGEFICQMTDKVCVQSPELRSTIVRTVPRLEHPS